MSRWHSEGHLVQCMMPNFKFNNSTDKRKDVQLYTNYHISAWWLARTELIELAQVCAYSAWMAQRLQQHVDVILAQRHLF